ncbi:putative ABC transport system permease protein [Clostridium pascui]|uniref:ABC transporter permease n=1 Tax=Clostridium pascui TaxID=46609 RepID=UPI00195BE89E|nr:ABC transporter permease [Clostridium pascui]MBM7871170.1 putative ABC transport system permease protein [Clostridium pascui]
MTFIENFKIALDSIRANKLRSLLTMLGIIIGISSVITIVSLGQGGQSTITGEFEKIGSTSVSIRVDTQKANKSDYITMEDINQIRDKITSVKYITPTLQKQGVVTSNKKSKRAYITGGNEELQYARNLEIIYGRFFNEREYLEGESVIVVDQVAARKLFGYEDVVGKTIKVGSKNSPKQALIIGVIKSEMEMFGGDDENIPAMVMAPVTLVQELYGSDNLIDSILVSATSKELSETAGNSALNILESRHNNKGRDIYKAEALMKQLEQINKIIGIFTAFIGAVAAISLIVGGIGVMNIMLVSVTERTREIGIRKAIGATTGTILLQFLTESVIISVVGGMIGMILGVIGANIIGSFANIVPKVSWVVVASTILFSSAVGIFFGIYPAKKAAQMDPIDALRYE